MKMNYAEVETPFLPTVAGWSAPQGSEEWERLLVGQSSEMRRVIDVIRLVGGAQSDRPDHRRNRYR